MPNPYTIGAPINEDQVLPWRKTDDKKRQSILSFKDRLQNQHSNVEQYGSANNYQNFYQSQQAVIDRAQLGTRTAQNVAQSQAQLAAQDRDRWAKEAQVKAQKDLQTQMEDYMKNNPYQQHGSVVMGPGGQMVTGGSGAGGGTWQQGQQYGGSDVELAQLARAAGFPESQIPMAVAVALAESGGKADATHGNSNGSMDNGLWQINSVHSSRPGFNNVLDPLTNAKLAFAIYKDAGNSWSPWVTAQNGLQNQYMQRAQAAVASPKYQQPWVSVPSYVANSGATTGLRNSVVSTALSALGTPYVWGGNSLTQGVDCSGLVQQAYQSVGISLPRTANEQTDGSGEFNAMGTRAPISSLRPGDLIAWPGNRSGQSASFVGHVAIYRGNGQIIEAPTQGVPVRTRALRPDENVYGVHLSLPGDK